MVALQRLRTVLARESEATGLPLSRLLAAAAVVHAVAAVLALNPWHPDEHFQILEFAWARGGLAPLGELPWEWEARIRPTLQPTLALLLLKGLRLVGVEAPFAWMLLLRLATLVVAMAVLIRVFVHVSPGLARPGRRSLWLSGLLLWFAPLFLFRFSSENLAGLALVAAIPVLAHDPRHPKRPARDFLAGLLFGLAFVFRFQAAFAVSALLAWVWWFRPQGRAAVLRMVAGAGVVVAAGALVDAWFYGAWVFTPWNYFRVNLLEGVASTFGTQPWWWYMAWTPVWMAPPLGPVVAALVAAGVAARPRSPWSWAFVAFFIGHSAVPHKEVRFLLPLLPFVPVLLARGVDLLARGGARPGPAWLWGAGLVLGAQNALLLALLLTPAVHRGREVDAHYMRWLWERAEATPGDTVYVLHEDGDPYLIYGNPANVYRHPRVQGVGHAPGAGVPATVPRDTPPQRLLLLLRSGDEVTMAGARSGETVYRAEAGYRALARILGLEGSGWVERLEAVDGWAPPSQARRLVEIHRGPEDREGRQDQGSQGTRGTEGDDDTP